jgi:hypothetical protein
MRIELRLKPLADMDVMVCLLKSLIHFGATIKLDPFDEKRVMDALEADGILGARTVVTYAGAHDTLEVEYEANTPANGYLRQR